MHTVPTVCTRSPVVVIGCFQLNTGRCAARYLKIRMLAASLRIPLTVARAAGDDQSIAPVHWLLWNLSRYWLGDCPTCCCCFGLYLASSVLRLAGWKKLIIRSGWGEARKFEQIDKKHQKRWPDDFVQEIRDLSYGMLPIVDVTVKRNRLHGSAFVPSSLRDGNLALHFSLAVADPH